MFLSTVSTQKCLPDVLYAYYFAIPCIFIFIYNIFQNHFLGFSATNVLTTKPIEELYAKLSDP